MRALLLLFVAAVTGLAAPAVLMSERPGALPGSGTVGQAWHDAGRIIGILFANARRDAAEDEVVASEPIFEPERLARTASVLGASLIWSGAFVLGGSLGLLYLSGSRSVLVVCAIPVLLYSCGEVSISADISPETRSVAAVLLGLALAAFVSGLFASRSIRRCVGGT